MDQRIYCGDQPNLPPTYTDFGSRYRCLRKGVGVGLNIARTRGGGTNPIPIRIPWYRNFPWYLWILVFLLVIGFFLIIFLLIVKLK